MSTTKFWSLTTVVAPQYIRSKAHNEGIYCLDVRTTNATTTSDNDEKQQQQIIATGAAGNSPLHLWDTELNLLGKLPNPTCSSVYSCRIGGHNYTSFLVSGTKSGQCLLHDIKEEKLACSVTNHKALVHAVDIHHHDHCSVLTGSADGTVEILDVRNLASPKNLGVVHNAVSSKGQVFCVNWCGEHTFLSAGNDYCIKRWDIRKIGGARRHNEALLTSYLGHTSDIRALEVDPSGGSSNKSFFVSGTLDGSLRIWGIDEINEIEEELIRIDTLIEKGEKIRKGKTCDTLEM